MEKRGSADLVHVALAMTWQAGQGPCWLDIYTSVALRDHERYLRYTRKVALIVAAS